MSSPPRQAELELLRKTVFQIATRLNFSDLVAQLKNSNANSSQEFGNNAENARLENFTIFDAIVKGDAAAVNEHCKRGKATAEKKYREIDFNAVPALFWAVTYGRPECLKIILKYDKDVNRVVTMERQGQGVFPFTPLELAFAEAGKVNPKVVKILLDNGATPPAANSGLFTRLHISKAEVDEYIRRGMEGGKRRTLRNRRH